MKGKAKRSGAAGGRRRTAAKDLATHRADKTKGGHVSVSIGAKQPSQGAFDPVFLGGVTVASGDINGDSSTAKLKP